MFAVGIAACVPVEVRRVSAARPACKRRLIYLFLLVAGNNHGILHMTLSSAVVLGSTGAIEAEDHSVQGAAHLVMAGDSAALVGLPEGGQLGRHMPVASLSRIEMLTANGILKRSPCHVYVGGHVPVSRPC